MPKQLDLEKEIFEIIRRGQLREDNIELMAEYFSHLDKSLAVGPVAKIKVFLDSFLKEQYGTASDAMDTNIRAGDLLSISTYLKGTLLFFNKKYMDGIEAHKKWIEDGIGEKKYHLEALGYFYLQVSKYPEAEESFKESMQCSPKRFSHLAHYGLARTFRCIDKFDEARESFLAASEDESGVYLYAQKEIAKMHFESEEYDQGVKLLTELLQEYDDIKIRSNIMRRLLIEALEYGHFNEASRWVEEMGKELTEDFDLKFNYFLSIADEEGAKGNWSKAISTLKMMCTLGLSEEQVTSVYNKLSSCFASIGDEGRAEEHFVQYQNFEKKNLFEKTVNKIKFYDKLRKYDQAIPVANSFLKSSAGDRDIDPESISLILRLKGRLLKNVGRYVESLKALDEALDREISPTSRFDVFLEKIRLFEYKNEDKKTLEILDEAKTLAYRPFQKSQLSICEITALTKEGRLIEARKALEECRGLSKRIDHELEFLTVEAKLNAAEGDIPKALSCLDRVIEGESDNASLLLLLIYKGQLLRKHAQYEESIDVLSLKSVRVSNIFYQAAALFEKGITLKDAERYSEAVESFEKARQLSEDFAVSSAYWIGNVLLLSDRFEEAMAAFKQVPDTSQYYKYMANFGRVICLFRLGEHEDTLAEIELLSARYAEDSLIKLIKAKCEITLEEYAAAERTLDQLRAKSLESSGGSHISLGMVYDAYSLLSEKKRDYFEAKKYIQEAIKHGSKKSTEIFEIDKKISVILENLAAHKDSKAEKDERSAESKIGELELTQPELPFFAKPDEEKGTNVSMADFGGEILCHYSSAETILFNILPGKFNHKESSEDRISIRFNCLKNVNDIEEGEFKFSGTHESEIVKAVFKDLVSKIKEQIKIFCMSWDNEPVNLFDEFNAPFLIPPMWSRYGKTYAGACLLFKRDKFCNAIKDNGIDDEYKYLDAKRVIYSYPSHQHRVNLKLTHEELLEMYDKDLNVSEFIADGSRLNALYFKPPQWDYEKEFRLTIFSDSDSPVMTSVPKDALGGIIIGARMEKGFRKMFEEVCETNKWRLFQYTPHSDSNKLSVLL